MKSALIMDLFEEKFLTLSGGRTTMESRSVNDLNKSGYIEVAFKEIEPPMLWAIKSA